MYGSCFYNTVHSFLPILNKIQCSCFCRVVAFISASILQSLSKMDISVSSCSPVLFQSNLVLSVGMNILFPKYEMTAESAALVGQSKLQTAPGSFTVITRTTYAGPETGQEHQKKNGNLITQEQPAVMLPCEQQTQLGCKLQSYSLSCFTSGC